jgi:hypothetical protein
MWDRTGENQVYVRQQKAAEEQLRFDKTEKPSRLASKDNGGSVHCARFSDPGAELGDESGWLDATATSTGLFCRLVRIR